MLGVFQGLAGIGMLVWYVAAIYVGLRLLVLARRGAHRPALLIGTYLLVAMGMGGAAMSLPMARGATETITITVVDRALLGSGCLFTAIGILAILTFTREVFRREQRWARGVRGAIAAIVVVGLLGHGLTTGFYLDLGGRFGVVFLVGSVLASGWTSLESLIYYRQMRRRLKIGLAEPIVANRFLLWGLGAGSAVALLLLSLLQEWMRIALSVETFHAIRKGSLPLMAFFGLASASCYLFAFSPAAWYRRLFERAPAGGA
ncbi:MAG: hypothetical protein CL819_09840 [Croceicoccus sp.]|jgi:hypothetical protein|nr:hypothetical protein [Croceicoccus sp.]